MYGLLRVGVLVVVVVVVGDDVMCGWAGRRRRYGKCEGGGGERERERGSGIDSVYMLYKWRTPLELGY